MHRFTHSETGKYARASVFQRKMTIEKICRIGVVHMNKKRIQDFLEKPFPLGKKYKGQKTRLVLKDQQYWNWLVKEYKNFEETEFFIEMKQLDLLTTSVASTTTSPSPSAETEKSQC